MAEKGGTSTSCRKKILNSARRPRHPARPHLAGHRKSLPRRNENHRKAVPEFQNVRIVACGTSWACGPSRKIHDRAPRAPARRSDYGSEFRYRDPIIDSDTLTVCISQSGETADTLAAQREANQKARPLLPICNVIAQ